MKAILEQLAQGSHLTIEQADELARAMASGLLEPSVIGAALMALRTKGETPDEVAGFARAMQSLARKPAINPETLARAVDIVGTGGDGSGTFNLSTGAAILTASCDVPVIKHGNRSISSRSGAADVLTHLGLPMPLDERQAVECLERTGFTFLFAPHYHPATGAIAPVRKALGIRTLFNMLGPLTNPARPAFGVIGAYSRQAAQVMAGAFAQMPITRVIVLHAHDGTDEPTPASPFDIWDVTPARTETRTLSAADFGLPTCKASELQGGDPAHNARALRAALTGERSAHRDALVLGAALALWCAGHSDSPRNATRTAIDAIDSGQAGRLLDQLASLFAGARA
jgi:anthranilate phosphoribosyltransferase